MTDLMERLRQRLLDGLPIHWVGDAPTSLHGNGASSFTLTTGDPQKVTCKLCLSLIGKGEHQPAGSGSDESPPMWWECADCDYLRGGAAVLQAHVSRSGHTIRPYVPGSTGECASHLNGGS